MRLISLPSVDRPEVQGQGRRLLFVPLVGAGLILLGLGLVALLCQFLVAPIAHGPEFEARSTVAEHYFYADQPAKTVAYQAGCLALPWLLALSFWAAQRWADRLSNTMVDRVNQGGILLYLLLMVSCVTPIVYCPHPPFAILPPVWILLPMGYSPPFYQPGRIVVLLAAAVVQFYFLSSSASRRNANRALILLLIAWLIVVPSRFYLPSEIDDDPRYLYHLNSVLDALSQVVNGHHLLIDFPHIYGGYIEMLGPIIRLFPREIGVLISALAVPNIVGMLCLLLAARLVVRHPAILFLCGLTLLATCCLPSSEDVNYSFLTARLSLPPVGLLAAILYFRQPTAFRYAATTAIAALATIWNLDAGIALWGSWLGTLALMALMKRNLHGFVQHVLAQGLSFVAVWTCFMVYLRLVSGQWPESGLLLYFQKFVVGSGYFCLPLLFPDMWIFIVTLYIGGLAIVLGTLRRGKASPLVPVMLMLSLLGLGLFSYYMGRSAPSNLISVAYPAILLGGILCTEGDRMMQEGILPKGARFLLLPTRIALFWWAFLMLAGLPDFVGKSGHVVCHWNDAEQTPLLANEAFIKEFVRPREDGVYFLSNQSGISYYLSDTLRPLKIPGTIELLQARDMDVVLEAIRSRRISKLLVDENFYYIQMYRPEIYEALRAGISRNYRQTAVGPTGRLVLYTPRQD